MSLSGRPGPSRSGEADERMVPPRPGRYGADTVTRSGRRGERGVPCHTTLGSVLAAMKVRPGRERPSHPLDGTRIRTCSLARAERRAVSCRWTLLTGLVGPRGLTLADAVVLTIENTAIGVRPSWPLQREANTPAWRSAVPAEGARIPAGSAFRKNLVLHLSGQPTAPATRGLRGRPPTRCRSRPSASEGPGSADRQRPDRRWVRGARPVRKTVRMLRLGAPLAHATTS